MKWCAGVLGVIPGVFLAVLAWAVVGGPTTARVRAGEEWQS